MIIYIIITIFILAYSFNLIADFQGGRDNIKKKTIYIKQLKTINSNTIELYEQEKRNILGQTNVGN